MGSNCGIYGGDNAFWGTNMSADGFMGFVDKLWILLNRIFAILLIVVVILFVILAIVGWTPVKVLVTGESSDTGSTASFRRRRN